MSKYLLIVIFLSLSIPQSLRAQADSNDVVYHKNGSIYVGTTVKIIPDVSTSMELTDGRTIHIYHEDILKITREPADRIQTYIAPRKRPIVRFETSVSYMMISERIKPLRLFHGGGFNFLFEIQKTDHFSILTGPSAQIIRLPGRYEFTGGSDDAMYGNIDDGFRTRVGVPVWFRFTYGSRVPFFFQIGFAAGADIYSGSGSKTYSTGAYQSKSITGWTRYSNAYVSPLNLGIGMRKAIKGNNELISYLELAPADLQIFIHNIYQPCLQIHVGYNFAPKEKPAAKKQP